MAKAKGPTTETKPDVEVLPAALTEEINLATQAGDVIRPFFAKVEAFIRAGHVLETMAQRKLDTANKLAAPTTDAEDEQIQTFAKSCTTDKKEIQAHWQSITSLLHGLHKRFVARRERGVTLLESAYDRANKLHQDYAAEKRRKEEAEQRRRDELAREEARQRQQAELDALEAEALAAESAAEDLSDREREFCRLIVERAADPLLAAKQAGYRDPNVIALRLLRQPKIEKALEGLRVAKASREQAAAVQQAPLDVRYERVQTSGPATAPGLRDVTRRKALITDEQALIAAVIAGQHGIPARILRVDQTALNDEARSLGELINRWPGCKLDTNTRIQ